MSNQRILHCCLLQGSLHAGRRQCPVESQHQIRRTHKRVGPEWDCALHGNIVGMCKPRRGCSEFDDLSLALVAVADVCAKPWSAFAVMIGRRGEARSVALETCNAERDNICRAHLQREICNLQSLRPPPKQTQLALSWCIDDRQPTQPPPHILHAARLRASNTPT